VHLGKLFLAVPASRGQKWGARKWLYNKVLACGSTALPSLTERLCEQLLAAFNKTIRFAVEEQVQ
jgi:hypothetical protein